MRGFFTIPQIALGPAYPEPPPESMSVYLIPLNKAIFPESIPLIKSYHETTIPEASRLPFIRGLRVNQFHFHKFL